jgi:hypothetical protein
MQADERIRPKDITPGFGGIPANVSWEDYGSVVFEMGLSQPWGGASGLESKALRWCNARGETGLEYLSCVKIEKTDGVVIEAQYKLFDAQDLIASQPLVVDFAAQAPVDFLNGPCQDLIASQPLVVDFAAQVPVDFLNGPCQIQLSMERVLGIARGVNGFVMFLVVLLRLISLLFETKQFE